MTSPILAQFPLRKEQTRQDRMYNIAVIILALGNMGLSTKPSIEQINTFLCTAKIRREIRAELQEPELSGESYNGDMRAHGDSIGGHGLELDTVRKDSKRYVGLTTSNIKKCQTYLNDPIKQKYID